MIAHDEVRERTVIPSVDYDLYRRAGIVDRYLKDIEYGSVAGCVSLNERRPCAGIARERHTRTRERGVI